MSNEEFEELFGNVPFENIEKIKEYINKNFVSKDKIREYKQKFEKDSKKEKVFMTQSSQINASLISFCDELLEE